MEPNLTDHQDDARRQPSTTDEFIARFLAELADLEERRNQDALARRLRKLPSWIRQDPER